jgi:hypothetical protein
MVQQTERAFDFLQKLYYEVSYLIKEVEGLLAEEEERFVIGRPAGYGVTARSSNGLEISTVRLWPLRKLAVFFVPEEHTKRTSGKTLTGLDAGKVIYLRLVLDDEDVAEPTLLSGVMYDFVSKNPASGWPTKFEHLMAHLEYNDPRAFRDLERTEYEDSYVKFQIRLSRINLFDLKGSDEVRDMVVGPALERYRSIAVRGTHAEENRATGRE